LNGSDWRLAISDWQIVGVAISHDEKAARRKRQQMAISDWQIVGVAISHDEKAATTETTANGD
jgi:hypothetical protein